MSEIIRSSAIDILIIIAWFVLWVGDASKNDTVKSTTWWETPFSLFICIFSTENFPNLAAYVYNFSSVKAYLEVDEYSILNICLICAWLIINIMHLRLFWFCLLVAAKNRNKFKILQWKYYIMVALFSDWLIYSSLDSADNSTVINTGMLTLTKLILFWRLVELYEINLKNINTRQGTSEQK